MVTLYILPDVNARRESLIATRRDLHQHPELAFDLPRTAGLVAERLTALGLEVKTGVGKSGVTATLRGSAPGPVTALRADMDALPIQETGDTHYKSTVEGVMHACGHDGHTAMLLATAEILAEKRSSLRGEVRFLFQPAEEGDGGARYMIADGCLKGVDRIFGLHLWNYQPLGEVGVRPGPILAAADIFTVRFRGVGGHGAAPQGTVDTTVVAAEFIQAVQTIVSRNINPLDNAVVTVGTVRAGHSFNIIADQATLTGTVRAYTESNRQLIKQRLRELLAGLEKMYGVRSTLEYEDGYPPTVNTAEETRLVTEAARKVVGTGVGDPYLSMGGEDFAYYLQKVPGCFFFVGSAPADRPLGSVPHHCSHFDIDERALLVGPSILLHLVDALHGGAKTPSKTEKKTTGGGK
ncbi:MAG: amidohydrolase [Candidatus Neomarinimicrobiota bacterium]|nr:MAG: amidohydrolase [Candidatus Neomarinimicrobiota bacterium]